jgi:hypothetical protein
MLSGCLGTNAFIANDQREIAPRWAATFSLAGTQP